MKNVCEQKIAVGQGRVHLVGAGPGDPDLITVKGRRLIESCGALVYDALVNPAMLDWVGEGCRCIFVGKQPGHRCASQDYIGDLLVALASEGLEVVRLKGGDPFVFGRGGEEAERLRLAGVPFTVVPAVTAAVAAGAFAGVPLTHRDHSSAVTFVSGHEDLSKGGPDATKVDWGALARSGSTLCLYMGMARLGDLQGRLLAEGLPAPTPVCVVQWAGTQRQRVLRSTLGQVPFAVVAEGLGSPAIVIIGKVAALADSLSWFQAEQGAPFGKDHFPPWQEARVGF